MTSMAEILQSEEVLLKFDFFPWQCCKFNKE